MDIDAAFNQARPLIGEPSDQTVEKHRAQLEEAMKTASTVAVGGDASAPEPTHRRADVSVLRPWTWRSSSLSSPRARQALVGVAASVVVLVGLAIGANHFLVDRDSSARDVAVGSEEVPTPAAPNPNSFDEGASIALPQSTDWSDEVTASKLVGSSSDYTDIFVATVAEGTEGEGCEGTGPLHTIKRVAPDGTTKAMPDYGPNGGVSIVTGSVSVVDGPGDISATFMQCDGFGSIKLVTSAGEAIGDLEAPDASSFATEPFWSADGSSLFIALTSDAGPLLEKYDARTGELVESTPGDSFVLGVFGDGTRVLRTSNNVAIGDPNNTVVGFEEPFPLPQVRISADGTRALISGPAMSGFLVVDSAGNRIGEGGGTGEVAASWSPDGHIASVAVAGGPTVITDDVGTVIKQIDATAAATHIDDVAFFDGGRRLAVSGIDESGQQHLWTIELGLDSAPPATATNVAPTAEVSAPAPDSYEIASAATAVPPTPTPGAGGALPPPAATDDPEMAASSETAAPTEDSSGIAYAIDPFATPDAEHPAAAATTEDPAAAAMPPPVAAVDPEEIPEPVPAALDPALPTGEPGTVGEVDRDLYYFPLDGGPAVYFTTVYPEAGINNMPAGQIMYNGFPAIVIDHIEFVVGSEPKGTAELRLYRIEETGTTDYTVWDQRTMTGMDSSWFYTGVMQRVGDVFWVEREFHQGACYFVDVFDANGYLIDDPTNPWPRPDLEALAADPAGPLCPSTGPVLS